jgi:hypothetical protein
MSLNQTITKKIEDIFSKFEKDKSTSDVDLINALRVEADGSSILFYFLLEKLLAVSFSRKKIILSKALLKYHLKSKYNENSDYIYLGGKATDDDDSIIKSAHDIVIKKGIFLRIIEKLRLTETLNAYVKFLMIREQEINESKYLSIADIKKYSDLDFIVEVMSDEFERKVDVKRRIEKFD